MSKKYYFFSDAHLGLHPPENSKEREKKLVRWLDEIKTDAAEVFMVGDIFDFWHEHKHVVPKGFIRFMGKLSEMVDSGIKIHFFTGNHDIWAYGYFEEELNIKILKGSIEREINGKKFFIGHGDGIGPGDWAYKLMKWGFTNKILQWFFSRLHPNFSMWIGKTWSKNSRYSKDEISERFTGMDKELQILFAKDLLTSRHFDYFVFGHRHIPYDFSLSEKTRIINLGDWIGAFTYAVFDGENIELKQYEGDGSIILRDKDVN